MKTVSMVIASLCLTVFHLADSSPRSRRIHDCESGGHPADVIFVLDASNSIWRPDFRRQIHFVKEISGMFRIGPNDTQVAVITYASFPHFQFHLTDYTVKADVLAAIDGVRQMGGHHTSTPDALRAMRERGFSGAHGGPSRANVTRVGIVITDGRSDDPEKTEAEAKRARDAGIHLFAVGVGLELDLEELEKIASFPSSYYTFTVEGYSGLENIKDLLAIKACTVTDPPTTTTTTTTTHSTPTTTTTTTTEVKKDDTRHNSVGHGKTGEMESMENTGRDLEEQRRGKDEGQVVSEDEDNKTPDDRRRKQPNGGSYGASGHEDDFEEERTIKRINKTNEDSDNGKPPYKWTDVRQDGYWTYDEHGQKIWIAVESKQDMRHGSNASGSEEGGGASKKTLEKTDRFDNQDYPVLPVDNHHHGHSKKNHSSKKKTVKNHDSKAKNPAASNELSVCRPKTPLDVVFVVDSKSVDRRSDRRLLETVRDIVEQVSMDDGLMRVQFVHSCSSSSSSSRPSPIAKSLPVDDNPSDPSDLLGSGSRQTADLFDTMTSKLTSNGGRPGRKRVGVYLTDGPSEGDLERTLEAVQAAKGTHDVEMFTVGLGRGVNPVELRAIASCDVAKHAFTLRHPRHHSKAKEIVKHVAQSLCSVR